MGSMKDYQIELAEKMSKRTGYDETFIMDNFELMRRYEKDMRDELWVHIIRETKTDSVWFMVAGQVATLAQITGYDFDGLMDTLTQCWAEAWADGKQFSWDDFMNVTLERDWGFVALARDYDYSKAHLTLACDVSRCICDLKKPS